MTMTMTLTLFRLAALSWFAGGIARPLMFLTDAFGYGTTPGASLGAVLAGAALSVAVGAFLWLRPGRGAAIVGVAFGFYVVPSLLYVQFLGTPPWLIVLAALGIAAFGFSVACLWRTRSGVAVGVPPV
jgi:hypothetical protein